MTDFKKWMRNADNVAKIIVTSWLIVLFVIFMGVYFMVTSYLNKANDKIKELDTRVTRLEQQVDQLKKNTDNNANDINDIYDRRAKIDEILEDLE